MMLYFYCSINDCKFRRNIVSLTALKTTLIFSVSTAVVKWWKSGLRTSFLTFLKKSNKNACTSVKFHGSPLNSSKMLLMLDCLFLSFSSSRSVLFKNNIMETFWNITLLTIVSNMFLDSFNRFVFLKQKKQKQSSIRDHFYIRSDVRVNYLFSIARNFSRTRVKIASKYVR